MWKLAAALLIVLLTTAILRADVVQTMEGKRYEGTLRIAPGGHFVMSQKVGSLVRIDLPNVLHASFTATEATRDSTLVRKTVETPGLKGQYYIGPGFKQLKETRVDPTINFAWERGSPFASIGVDRFSVRWTGKIKPKFSEEYTFTFSTQDRGVVTIDGQAVTRGNNEQSGTITLREGIKYDIRVEFHEDVSGASAKLYWSSPSQPKEIVPNTALTCLTSQAEGKGNGLRGFYYGDADLRDFKAAQIDSKIDFTWGAQPPALLVPANGWSARWVGHVVPRYTEPYTFHVHSAEGVRLWVNNVLLADNWNGQPQVKDISGSITLEAGFKYDIQLEVVKRSKQPQLALLWQSRNQPREVIPQSQLFATPDSNDPNYNAQLQMQDGAVLSGLWITSADDKNIRATHRQGKTFNFTPQQVARILMRTVQRDMLNRLPEDRVGVLLNNGDFVDGDFRGIAEGKIQLSSILFGHQTFDATEVAAISLRSAKSLMSEFIVHTTDGAVYATDAIRLENGKLTVSDRYLGAVSLEAGDLRDVRYVGRRLQALAALEPSLVEPQSSDSPPWVTNRTLSGMPMDLIGSTIHGGLSMKAGTSLQYELEGAYSTFICQAGVPMHMLPTARVRFVVIGDGRELHRSPDRTSIDNALPLAVNVTGIKQLTLRVLCDDPALSAFASALWGDPTLIKQTP